MFRISKIEQHSLPKSLESQIEESEFEVVLRFNTKDLQWGWEQSMKNVLRSAINGISPTQYVA